MDRQEILKRLGHADKYSMASFKMSYDITFCEGKGCERRDLCHRYKHLLRFRADTDPNKGSLISMTIQENPNNCKMFWEEK